MAFMMVYSEDTEFSLDADAVARNDYLRFKRVLALFCALAPIIFDKSLLQYWLFLRIIQM